MKQNIEASPYGWYINNSGQQDTQRVIMFDTTLRDGEQSRGASLLPEQKGTLASLLYDVGVDAIEAGFAASDRLEQQAIELVAHTLRCKKRPVAIFSLARAHDSDIDYAWQSVKDAVIPGIHTFISTSEEQRKVKFPYLSMDDITQKLCNAVCRAASYMKDAHTYGIVEVSAEDATRTNIEQLVHVYKRVLEAIEPYRRHVGFTFNLPDTVGAISDPVDYRQFFEALTQLDGIEGILLSAHTHNDKDLAVANALQAIRGGARQVEVTSGGIGERAGNASLDAIAICLEDKGEFSTGICRRLLHPLRIAVAQHTGCAIGEREPVHGLNVHAHEAGIHQDGSIKGIQHQALGVYEGVSAKSVAKESSYPLGRRSGKHGLYHVLSKMGYRLDDRQRDDVYFFFLEYAQTAKIITCAQLYNIMDTLGYHTTLSPPIQLVGLSSHIEGAQTRVDIGIHQGEHVTRYQGSGAGVLSASVDALQHVLPASLEVELYAQHSVGKGVDAQARTHVRCSRDACGDTTYVDGVAQDTCVQRSAVLALLEAVNKQMYDIA
ncbi:MAG: alpha-isopropylmalate synthase regulatory domain-containing protein [Candidatus Woesearchaeota archaeon]